MSDIWVIRIDAHTEEVSYEKQSRSLDNLNSVLKSKEIQSVRISSLPNVYILSDKSARFQPLSNQSLSCDENPLYFKINDWILVNRAILVSLDQYGDWCDVNLNILNINTIVTFLPADYIDQPIPFNISNNEWGYH